MDEAATKKGNSVKVDQRGKKVANGFLRWLVALFIPSPEDLFEAGVYLDERDDRLQKTAQEMKLEIMRQAAMFGGESTHETMQQSNDERPYLLPAERYSGADSRIDEK